MTIGQVGEVRRRSLAQLFSWQGRLEVTPETVSQDNGLSMNDGAVRYGAANSNTLIARLNSLSRLSLFGCFL